MKPKKQFSPQDLRNILAFLLVIVLVGGSAIFYWGLGLVKEYSDQVNQKLADADASSKQVNELQTLKNQLSQSTSLVAKADQLFSTPNTYRAQALSDIKSYGDAAGLSIARTSFDDSGSYIVTVKLSSPTSFSKLITFLNNVESNLPKLQVNSISLKHTDKGGSDSVEVEDIKISVSVR